MRHLAGYGLLLILCYLVGMLPRISYAQGQWVLSGTVHDELSGEPLPGASVQVAGTYSGTISNSEGVFQLRVEEDSVTLIVRFIGFVTKEVTARRGGARVEVTLSPSSLTMPEIVITGEDPAIRIMRRVIEEKQRWRENLETYTVNAYNRFRMENDTGIVSIWESGTKAFWDRERGMREISLWQEQTDNMEIDAFLPAALFVANLYDDDLDIAGHSLMGVTHPDALSKYRFRLVRIESSPGESDVFVIDAEPKQATFSGFHGTIRVQDDSYAMLSADLTPGASFVFPPPIQDLRATYRQQFAPYAAGTWLPVDLQTRMEMKVGIERILSFPVFRINQLSRLSDFEINVPLPDSLYKTDEIVVVDSSVARPTARPADLVAVPLSTEEMAAYATIDSTMTIGDAYEPTGVLARVARAEARVSSDTTRTMGRVISAGNQINLDLTPDLWYNRVEGFRLGLRGGLGIVGPLQIRGMIGWESATKEVNSGYGMAIGSDRRAFVRFRDETSTTFTSAIRGRFFNSADVTLGRDDYFDYHREQGWEAGVELNDLTSADLSVSLTWSRLDYSSAMQSVSTSWLGFGLHDRLNPTVDQGELERVTFTVDKQWEYVRFPIGPQRRATLRLEKGLGGTIAGRTDYWRGEVDVFLRLPTFSQRRFIPNALDVRIVAGKIWGDAPIQRFGIVDGASTLTAFGSLKTNDHPPYWGEEWGLFVWEHTFRTVPFERLGWDWAVRRHWNLIVTGGHGWSTADRTLGAGRVQLDGAWHHEAGVSLSGLFTMMRLDASWRLDEPGFAIGISTARIF